MHRQLSEESPLGIILLDENRIFADVLAMRLRAEPEGPVVAVARSVEDVTVLLADPAVDLLIVDYGVGGDLALPLMAELSTRDPDTRPTVLVLSGTNDIRTVVAALESGARGWVTKDSSFAALWSAVREVQLGHMVLSPSVIEPILAHLRDGLRSTEAATGRPDFLAGLSPRQYEVLRCLVAGLSKKEIAERLYLSVNTVRTHVQHLLRHADEHTTLALVAAARHLGVTSIDEFG